MSFLPRLAFYKKVHTRWWRHVGETWPRPNFQLTGNTTSGGQKYAEKRTSIDIRWHKIGSLIWNFVVKKLEVLSPFCGATDSPCFRLLVMSTLGFKARMDSLACFFSCVLFLRFTSGVAPAGLNCQICSQASWSMYLHIGGAKTWDREFS